MDDADWDADLSPGANLLHRHSRVDDAEMDITPMIDITFLLLIFFLVCSTPDQKSAVELPNARHGKGIGERNSVMITISDEGVDSAPVYLADGKVGDALPEDPNEQKTLIAEAIEKGRNDPETPKEHVLIKADRNVAFREVDRVIRAVSKVEGAKIHLAVNEAD